MTVGLLRAAVLLLLLSALTAGASDYNGAQLYTLNCSNCHGTYGAGDGAMAPDLPVVLLDLRYLSQRNGGVFPRDFVRRIVDGREVRAQHGPAAMPVWGAEFSRLEGGAQGTAQRVSEKIAAITSFLESNQLQ